MLAYLQGLEFGVMLWVLRTVPQVTYIYRTEILFSIIPAHLQTRDVRCLVLCVLQQSLG